MTDYDRHSLSLSILNAERKSSVTCMCGVKIKDENDIKFFKKIDVKLKKILAEIKIM